VGEKDENKTSMKGNSERKRKRKKREIRTTRQGKL